MNAPARRNLGFFLLFVALALLLTYPLVLHVGSALRGTDLNGLGDPLLNTWILAWNDHKLAHLDFSGFFDGNIFHPQLRTILYSEHLLPLALMALPIYLLTGNPILAYNLIFLLGFALSGFGMFCLARHLTKSPAASVASGIIYAFSPFMMSHTYQIQVVSAWGIPFAFLSLHKFFEENRLKPLLLFALFYIIQSLSNGYYALYLTVFAALWILFQTIVQKKYPDPRFWAKIFLFGALAAAVTGPFYYLYARVHSEMGFIRGMDFYAGLKSYIAAPMINRLYGRLLARFIRPEGELFPGLVAAVLGALGILALVRARKGRIAGLDGIPRLAFFVRRAVNYLILATSVVVISIMGEGGLTIKIGGKSILTAHNIRRPLNLLLILFLVRAALDLAFRFSRGRPARQEERNLQVYAGILLLAVLFTFGPNGPYKYLYDHVPGFQAVRVASRFDVFVMFALAVLAAFGLRTLIARLRPAGKRVIATLACLAIGAEYLCIPVPFHVAPGKDMFPDVYKWLASIPKPVVLAELPFPPYDQGSASIEAARMYFSTLHWKRLVNGYSGWFPPLYTEVCRRSAQLPLDQLIKDFRTLGVDYVLFHFDELRERDWPDLSDRLLSLGDDIKLARQFGYDYVFEVLPKPPDPVQEPSLAVLKKIPRTGWTASASVGDDRAKLAIDGSRETRWDSGPQNPGDTFEIDLGKPTVSSCVSLIFGPSGLDFPRGYRLEVSSDKLHWTEAARAEQTIVPILRFAKPKELALNIFYPRRETRYIRVTNLGTDHKFYWSIYEAEIYE